MAISYIKDMDKETVLRVLLTMLDIIFRATIELLTKLLTFVKLF